MTVQAGSTPAGKLNLIRIARTLAILLIFASLFFPWTRGEGGTIQAGWQVVVQASAWALGIVVRPFLLLVVAALLALFWHRNKIVRWAYRFLLLIWLALAVSALLDPLPSSGMLWGGWLFFAAILLAVLVEIASFFGEDRGAYRGGDTGQ